MPTNIANDGSITVPGTGTVANMVNTAITIVNTASGVFKTIRDNAKRKKAQGIANAGGYNTLTDYQKMLIGYVNPLIFGKTDPATLPGLFAGISPSFVMIVILFFILVFAIRSRSR